MAIVVIVTIIIAVNITINTIRLIFIPSIIIFDIIIEPLEG